MNKIALKAAVTLAAAGILSSVASTPAPAVVPQNWSSTCDHAAPTDKIWTFFAMRDYKQNMPGIKWRDRILEPMYCGNSVAGFQHIRQAHSGEWWQSDFMGDWQKTAAVVMTITMAKPDIPPYYQAVDKTCWRKKLKLPYASEEQEFIVVASTNNNRIITAYPVTDASKGDCPW